MSAARRLADLYEAVPLDWPGINVLIFMGLQIEADPPRATVWCCSETGAPDLCRGRVVLAATDWGLWPASDCSNGHPHTDAMFAYAHHIDSLDRGRPPPDADPVSTFVRSLARHAAAIGIDKQALKLAIQRAGHAA